MTTLTLLTKINNNKQLKEIAKTLKREFENLEIEAKILGTVADGWVQIALAGEDELIATNYVIKEIGICPNKFGNIKNFSTLKGYIKNTGNNEEKLSVDVGVFQPEIVYATVPLRHLQTQLVERRKIDLAEITELFGLHESLPIDVKIVNVNEHENNIEAELSSMQIRKYTTWRESLLDRLLVLGSTVNQLKAALDHARLDRDVIGIESLGLLEHALMCKLGTDAAGLIPKIGRNLRDARFAVFNPKKLRKLMGA